MGVMSINLPGFANEFRDETREKKVNSSNSFNMSGYAAPKMDRVRVGIIGLGNRGEEAVRRLCYIDGLDIVALCDKYSDRTEKCRTAVVDKKLPDPKTFSGSEDAWKGLCDMDLDLVYICTPWHWHTPMAIYSMKAGKHVAVEVPVTQSMDECWELVETSENTKKHCVILENCCYDFFEMLTLNMARQGLFGEIVHTEGAYIHDLMDLNFSKTYYADLWRLKENATRNGNLYPTHGLGPVAQCLDINRGDRMEYLVSVSSGDFSMHDREVKEAGKDPMFQPFINENFRGNMNTTTIKTEKGKTIMIQHDVSSPRPYSRIHLISGTKGIAQKWPGPERIAFGHSWLKKEEMDTLYDKHTPPLIKHIGNIAKEVGGHGGMDFVMDWRLIDCLRNGLPMDMDVYDAASWSAVGILSEVSVKKRSMPMLIPDYTRGNYKTNEKVDLTLSKGVTTGVRKLG
jgi:hypothetical protein